MSARVRWLMNDWDWRPLARTALWLAIAFVAIKRGGYRLPSLSVIAHELILGWLLTFGLLTRLQLWLALAALRLFMAFDDWTYAVSEWIARPIAGSAPFAVNFLVTLVAQLGLVAAVVQVLIFITRGL